jgi:hypothetical protein
MAGSGHDSGARRRPGMIRSTQSTVKALPERLHISIGGYFGPCYSVTLEEGRLIYAYSARGPSGGEPKPEWPLEPKLRELLGLSPLPGPDEIQPSAKQWRNFRGRSTGSTFGAGNVITWILPSATGPIGPLKSFTRIDRLSRVAITAFRGGTDERFPLPSMRGTIPSRISVVRLAA